MRSDNGTDAVNLSDGVGEIGFEGRIHRIFQRLCPAGYGYYFRAKHFHPRDVGSFLGDIDRTHVNVTVQSEQSRCGCQCDSMLSRSCLGDDFFLSHFLGEKRFPEAVVDLVRPCMVQVFPFQVYLSSPH